MPGKGRRRVSGGPEKGVPKTVEKRQMPQSEMGPRVDKTFTFSTLLPYDRGNAEIKASKAFQESPPRDYPNLFLEKCEQCRILCDFAAPAHDTKTKSTKTQLLKHIASAFTIPHFVRTLSQEAMSCFYSMLAINLFRPIPEMPHVMVIDAHDCLLDYAWPHLSLAYDALLASLICPISASLPANFIYQLVGNGVAPDGRERIAVRDILHSLYTKFMNQRAVVRENIAHQFANGKCSSELLQFFVSVVSGFNSPLNPEHAAFYQRSILPLHSLPLMPQFSEPLIELIVKYITKSGFLLEPTVEYLVKHWPRSHRQKQGIFVKELETVMIAFEIHVTPKMAAIAFNVIGESTLNENMDVADKAVDALMNPKLAFTIRSHAATIYTLVIEPTYRAARKHWDACVRNNAFIALQALSELDQAAFARANEAAKISSTKSSARFGVFKTNWGKIIDYARTADRSIPQIDLEIFR